MTEGADTAGLRKTWEGGGYEGREGITVDVGTEGLVIGGWYDGGPDLEPVARLSWDEIDALRKQVGATQ